MSETLFVGPAPRLKIDKVNGDLSIVGWDSEEMQIRASQDDLQLRRSDNDISISCEGDLTLRIPKGAAVSVQSVAGDMSARNLGCPLEMGDVRGDASVRAVAGISVARVGSDFALRSSGGDVYVRQVDGDALVRDVVGRASLDHVAKNLVLREVQGDIHAEVGEDVVAYLAPLPGQVCSVTAGDGILLVLPVGADASLFLKGDSIHVQWPGVENDDARSREVRLGDASARIDLNGGGEVRVSDQFDAGERADEFGNFAGMSFDWSGFGDMAGRRAQAAARRAGKKAAAAAKRVERQWGRTGQDWSAARRSVNLSGFSTAVREPASDEERLTILRMLQEKKISAEEADKLLSALEGER